MARPRSDQPTPAELEVLRILWNRGPSTVREVLQELNRGKRRAYTSAMSLLNVMVDKGLLTRSQRGRAFVYQARQPREKTLGGLLGDLVHRAFDGSTAALVAQLLDQSSPSDRELAAIRQAIDRYTRQEKSR